MKEELFRTVLPMGWSSFGTPACLGMSEDGLIIPFEEEGTPGIETTIGVDPGCDQRFCFVISDINGEGKLTVMDNEPIVIHTEYFSDPDSICLNFTEGSYSSLTFIFEMTNGESFTLANVKLEEICSINVQVADVISAQDYMPFGSIMPGRKFHPAEGMHRYGFNGKEQDGEFYNSDGNSYDYGFRIYNPRIGKFLSVDPLLKSYPYYSPYQFAGNSPILFADIDGLEPGPSETWFALNNPKAALVLKNSAEVATEVSQDPNLGLSGPRDGVQDAFRHAYAMALSAQKVGAELSVKGGDAHERDGDVKDGRASEMDRHNNRIGAGIGEINPDATPAELRDLVLNAMENGELMIIYMDQDGNYLDSNDEVLMEDAEGEFMSSKQIVPSNTELPEKGKENRKEQSLYKHTKSTVAPGEYPAPKNKDPEPVEGLKK